MLDRSQNTDGFRFRFFLPEQVDEILRQGAKNGPRGSHAAIERILRVEPDIERSELWRRLRRLRFPPANTAHRRNVWTPQDTEILSRGYQEGSRGKRRAVRELLKRHPDWRPHIIWRRAAKLHLVRKVSKRGEERGGARWTEHDNQILINLAGYKTSRHIARILHRSEAAVRCRLMLLGKSTRVHLEGFSRQGLAADLHLGKNTVQRLIVEGFLEVRDPRITRESLGQLRESGLFPPAAQPDQAPQLETGNSGPLLARPSGSSTAAIPRRSSRAKRVWSEAAESLGVPLGTVEDLIRRRVLKLYDPTVTEKSIRHLCRFHGSIVDGDLLNRETREWLQTSMDWVRSSGQPAPVPLQHLRKHAHTVRQCECGRTIRGNVYFRHVRRCTINSAGRSPDNRTS
jgi:hypothetical protein